MARPKTHLAHLAVALLAMATALAAPFQAPPTPRQFVTDDARILSASTVADLDAQLARFQRETSTQILVVTYPEIPGGMAMEDFTQRTAEAWGVGQKATDNGAVLFIFPQQRKMRIEVGYGLEGALPDALAKRIIADEITPAFRLGNYDTGVTSGVSAILSATRGEYQSPDSSSDTTTVSLPPWPVFVGIIIFLIISFVRGPNRRGRYLGPGNHRHGRSTWGGGGFGGFGGGGGSRGGGFSGGGGSFGGGGASGSW